MINKKIAGIYAITPETPLDLSLVERLIIRHKISILQYRSKITTQITQFNQALQLRNLCLQYHTLFIVNNDINLAQKVMADGVHLGQFDGTINKARNYLGKNALIGVSCYDDLKLAEIAEKEGADYVAFGSLFPSKTKPNAPHCPLKVIVSAKKQLHKPIVGIGGINFNNQQQAFAAGCDAVAMISALFDNNID